jgi:hypothetical protein
MPVKTSEHTKQLRIPSLKLTTHWKLERWAKDMELDKIEAAEKILEDFLKKIKLTEVEA